MRFSRIIGSVVSAVMFLTACNPIAALKSTPATATQPVKITGTFSYSNDFVLETYYVEQAVALADMHGFVIRDQEWVTPVESQVLGYMNVDYDNNKGTFSISLPVLPEGVFNDVDNNNQAD